jgi:DNA-binding PadR family transcriptional regulator
MPIKHAVLGLLVERRSYGFELATRLRERLGAGLAVPNGTVYASLRALEADGLAQVAKRVVRGRQERIYFAPTDAGVQAFRQWMDEPLSREPLRGDLFLKLALMSEQHLPVLREAFERLELECVAELARLSSERRLAMELADPVPLATAATWALEASAVDHLHADLRFVSRTLLILRRAETEGSIPRAALVESGVELLATMSG